MTSYAAACCCKDDDDDGGGDGGDGIPGCCDTNPNLVTVNVNLLVVAQGNRFSYINGGGCSTIPRPFSETTTLHETLLVTGTVTWDLHSGDPPVSNVIARAANVCECNFDGPRSEGNGGVCQGCTLLRRAEAGGTFPVTTSLQIVDFGDEYEPGFNPCDEDLGQITGCAFVLGFHVSELIYGTFNTQTDCVHHSNNNDPFGNFSVETLSVSRRMIWLINRTPGGACELGELIADHDTRAWTCFFPGGSARAGAYTSFLYGGCTGSNILGPGTETHDNFVSDYGFDPCGSDAPCYKDGSFSTRYSSQTTTQDGRTQGTTANATLTTTNFTHLAWD